MCVVLYAGLIVNSGASAGSVVPQKTEGGEPQPKETRPIVPAMLYSSDEEMLSHDADQNNHGTLTSSSLLCSVLCMCTVPCLKLHLHVLEAESDHLYLTLRTQLILVIRQCFQFQC